MKAGRRAYRKMLLAPGIILLLFASTIQAQKNQEFSIEIDNRSGGTAVFSFHDTLDSVTTGTSRRISAMLDSESIPFYLFVDIKNRVGHTGGSTKKIRILYPNVPGRKVLITPSGEVTLQSTTSEELYETYQSGVKRSGFWNRTDSFIRANRNDMASAEIIYVYLCDPEYTADSIQQLYNLLTRKARQSVSGKKVQQYITARYFLKPGSLVRDFALQDTTGRLTHLSSVKSKYVLIDFWFSRCGPCIESFPALRELYAGTDRSKLEIIGISVDAQNEQALWRSMIRKYSLGWMNLLDPRYDIALKTFGISLYPTKILLDEHRKIVRINPSNEDIAGYLSK
jgi:peroxiredoxin